MMHETLNMWSTQTAYQNVDGGSTCRRLGSSLYHTLARSCENVMWMSVLRA